MFKKKERIRKEEKINPFASKEIWDKVLEAEKNGLKKVSLPGIGIEKTPIYIMNQI